MNPEVFRKEFFNWKINFPPKKSTKNQNYFFTAIKKESTDEVLRDNLFSFKIRTPVSSKSPFKLKLTFLKKKIQ
jgi:hypothetical protein